MKRTIRFLLVVVMIAGNLLASGALVSAQATPDATPVAEPSERETVLDITFAELPGTPAFVGLARLKFPSTAGIVGGSIAGPRIFLIETGEFAVLADDPAIVWRENDPARAEDVPAGAETRLAAGDLLIVQGNPPFTVVNISDEPASLLDIVIWPPISERIRPFVTEAGVIFEPLVIGDVQQFPDTPARMLLERFSLPREAALPFELDLGPRLLYVESGVLGIAAWSGTVHYSSSASNSPGSVSGRLRDLDPGDETLITAGGAVTFQAGATGLLQNLGRTRLDLLDLRFEPVTG